MRFLYLASTLVLASTAVASYKDITTLGFDVCIPTTVQVTVTTTISYVAGAEDISSKYSKGNGHAAAAGYGDAGALTSAGSKGYGGGEWDEEDDSLVYSTKGAYIHGDYNGHAQGNPVTSARAHSKGYSPSQYGDEDDVVSSKKGYGYANHQGYEDDSNDSRGPYQKSSAKGGYGNAYSSVVVASSRKSYPGHLDNDDVDHASSAYPSLHWSRYSNSSTSAHGLSSSSATRSSLSFNANSQSSKSSSSGAVSSSSGRASSSSKLSSSASTATLSSSSSAHSNGTSSAISSSRILDSSSSASAASISSSAYSSLSSSNAASSSSVSSSVSESSASVDSSSSASVSESSSSSSTISISSFSSETSSATSSDVSSSTFSESSSSTISESSSSTISESSSTTSSDASSSTISVSSSSSSITSSDSSSITSVTSLSSESSSTLSSATSSASHAICVPDGSGTCSKSSDCCGADSGSACRQGTCKPCIAPRNHLGNNGFGTGALAPWTASNSGAAPVAHGVGDFDSDGDTYGFLAAWRNRNNVAAAMTVEQTFDMPSGTTVSCDAFVKQMLQMSGCKFTMKMDGVEVVVKELANEAVWEHLGPVLVPLTGDRHVLQIVLEPYGGHGATTQRLVVDGVSITPMTAPSSQAICGDPDPPELPDPEPQLPCIKVGDRIVNGGFSDGTTGPFTKQIFSTQPIVEGVVTDPSGSADNDGRYYKAVFNPGGNVDSVVLTQTDIQLPSGTKVLCLARVRHDRTDEEASTFMLLINGQQCGPALQHGDAAGTSWVEVDGVVTLSGDTHTLSLIATPNAITGPDEVALFIDNIELIPLELPAGRSFCSEPPVTCRNDGTFGCATDSDCCTASQGSTCISNICTPCFKPANLLLNPSFGSGLIAPWSWTTNRNGPASDHAPEVVPTTMDGDGHALSFLSTSEGSVFVSQAISLPAGSALLCSAFVKDDGRGAARYKLTVGTEECGVRSFGTLGNWGTVNGQMTLSGPADKVTVEMWSSGDGDRQILDGVRLTLLESPNGAPHCFNG